MTIKTDSMIHSKTRSKLPVIFLMGPTAAGKTDLAIALVQKIPAEIISVDSAMVYRGMDIGTGKPTPEQLQMAPHHGLDIRDPRESYSAAEFRKDALTYISDIHARGRIPVLVGGTLLYFRAIEQGLSPLPSAHPEIRAKLLEEGQRLGWQQLHQRLKIIDPDAAQRIHPNDPQRLQRALEVYEMTGKAISSFWKKDPIENFPFHVHAFALLPKDRKKLHERIEQRFYKMLDIGLFAEVEQLYERGDLHLDLPSMRAVGYRQVWCYLQGKYTYETMVNQTLAATRQLAKRQLTWLRSLSGVQVLDLENTHSYLLQSMLHSIS